MSRSRRPTGRDRAAPAASATSSNRSAARGPIERPGRLAPILLAALAALCLLAPPESNWLWAVNGFRSVPLVTGMGILLAAVTMVGLTRSFALAAAAGLALAAVVAFPLREKIHFLGDTAVRIGAISVYVQRLDVKPLVEWAHQVHAAPLDFALNFLGVAALHRAGLALETAVACVSFAIALVFMAGVWRVTSRWQPPDTARVSLAAALIMTGALEAFAGYVEPAGLLMATAAWWWSEMLSPLRSQAQAARIAAAWGLVLVSHRMGAVLVLALIARAVGPSLPGDEPRGRRALITWVMVAVAAAATALLVGAGTAQLGRDLSELFATVRTTPFRAAALVDALNLILLVAPLVLLAPALAGGQAVRSFVTSVEAKLFALAALPLLPLLILPPGPNGLGAHRDWDDFVLLGLTLTLAEGALLARVPAQRLRGAMVACLPVLTLGTLGWVAVNANTAAAVRRAEALVTKPPALADAQRSHGELYLSRWWSSQGELRKAAESYERSYDLVPTPNRGLRAAHAWASAGELERARRLLDRVRSRGQLDSLSRAMADTLERQIEEKKREGSGGAP